MRQIFWHKFLHHPTSLPTFRRVWLIGLIIVLAIALVHFHPIDGVIGLLMAAGFAIWSYHFLVAIEWRLAAHSVLSALTDKTALESLLPQALELLKNTSLCDGAIALRQIDEVTAKTISSLPANMLAGWELTPDLFKAAIAENRCIYYSNYQAHSEASPILKSYGAKALAILPLASSLSSQQPPVQGAILLIWHRHQKFSIHFETFINSLLWRLSFLLRTQTNNWELQNLQAKLSAILATIPHGIIFIDASGQEGWLNTVAAQQLNLSPGSVSPQAISQAMTALRMRCDNAQEIAQQAAQFFTQPDVKITNWQWIYSQPQPLILNVCSTAMQIREVPGRLWVMEDITEQYLAQRELEIAKVKAEAATVAKSMFLANMSHEIRTPMNAILGFTELLLYTELTSQQQEYVDIVQNSSEALLGIINDILDFSKIEAGKVELDLKPLDLRDVIESALDLFTNKASEKGLELAYLIDPNVPHTIIADVTRLRQILVNLIGNAIKFTAAGEVTITVAAQDSDRQTGELPNHGLYLHFVVRDTGMGISSAGIERLFESFHQVDNSSTRNYGGTGLGLAISKRLCELMGGNIWVESEVERGSQFHFTVQTRAALSQLRVYSSGIQPQLECKHILVVDDNAINRLSLASQCRSWGMLVETVDSGFAALKYLQENECDLAILDMQMPAMDGITLATAIRQQIHLHTLPLVMLTSMSSLSNNSLELKALNFAAFVAKPIKLAQLHSVLVKIFTTKPITHSISRITSEQLEHKHKAKCRLHILIAEDNPINQKVLLLALNNIGYKADIASNGREALEATFKQSYDMIFMDMQMPEMGGLEATRKIRTLERVEKREHIQIVAMTANAMQGDREECLRAGMDDYISKPIRLEDIERVIDKSCALVAS